MPKHSQFLKALLYVIHITHPYFTRQNGLITSNKTDHKPYLICEILRMYFCTHSSLTSCMRVSWLGLNLPYPQQLQTIGETDLERVYVNLTTWFTTFPSPTASLHEALYRLYLQAAHSSWVDIHDC
jgi:hypothetical protein